MSEGHITSHHRLGWHRLECVKLTDEYSLQPCDRLESRLFLEDIYRNQGPVLTLLRIEFLAQPVTRLACWVAQIRNRRMNDDPATVEESYRVGSYRISYYWIYEWL